MLIFIYVIQKIMAWHFEIKMSFQNKGKILAFKNKIKMPNIFGDFGIFKKNKNAKYSKWH